MKGIVSSTYMSFIGVRLSIKGRNLFYWVVVHLFFFNLIMGTRMVQIRRAKLLG